jgi:hypothetical protein
VWNNPLNATDPSGYVANFLAAWAVNWAQGYLIGQIATALKIASFVNTAFAVYNTANSILSVAKAYTAWNDGAGGAVWGNLIGGFAKSWAMGVGNSCASGACDFGFDPFGVDNLGKSSEDSQSNKDLDLRKDKNMLGDGSFNEKGELIGAKREAFEKEFISLNDEVSQLKLFHGNDAKSNALDWLHEHVHALAVKYDVEITANLSYTMKGRTWRIDSIGTSYNRHTVNIRTSRLKGNVGRYKFKWGANWHSHARGFNPRFSGADKRVMKRYESHDLSWFMSHQDGNEHKLVEYKGDL